MPEWDFVEMLEHGMPPTCGFGFGERFFAFLEDKPLRECQYFPFMKPVHRVEEKFEEEPGLLFYPASYQEDVVVIQTLDGRDWELF